MRTWSAISSLLTWRASCGPTRCLSICTSRRPWTSRRGSASWETRHMDERLLELYNTELRHLRETAAEFGRDFPKIAGRLSLDLDAKEVCPDPYVERLLEGFAFLAARVHLKLDAEFPRFTQGLLETVYPDYLCPVPSMAIVKFQPEEKEGALAPGFVIKRGSLLRSQLGKGERTACTFSTAQERSAFDN